MLMSPVDNEALETTVAYIPEQTLLPRETYRFESEMRVFQVNRKSRMEFTTADLPSGPEIWALPVYGFGPY